jgi:cyclohexanone monooxygenase
MPDRRSDSNTGAFDVVIVGAGFSGLYMLHRMRELGFTARLYEAGQGVGGTWFWNRYPGARCDIESVEYSYSFSEELQREWQWSERYASQPEILRYLNYVADRFDLRRDIQLETRVTSATFDETEYRWTIATDKGDQVSARFCIMATGCLSTAKLPEYKGLETFQGPWYHTGNWPHEGVNFEGQRVGVIGTGSSGIQSIPKIAEQASHLFVFQRTPNFSVPAQNAPLPPEVSEDWKTNHAEHRQQIQKLPFAIAIEHSPDSALAVTPEERQRVYEQRWQRGGFALMGAFADLIFNKEANDTAADFVRSKIRGIVRDPAVAERLSPKDYPIATKRICVDTGYYATFNRENVTLVDVRDNPIEEITPTGVRTRDAEYALDALVFASGFDAMTGSLNRIEIRGRNGATLQQKWAQGPRTYLGLMVAGFPNLFVVAGPGSPSVLSNMVVSIEQHVDWIADCLVHLRNRDIPALEATEAAENEWVAHVNAVANMTLFPLANSWYMGANVPGKTRIFMPYIGGFPNYQKKCVEVAATGYEGFALSLPARSAAGAA